MDDLFQLLIALAIIFFGLLGGGRRKKKPPPGTRPSQAGTTTRERPGRTRRPPIDVNEIEQILRQEVGIPAPVPDPEPPPEPAPEPEPSVVKAPEPRVEDHSAWANGLGRQAKSLEKLEPSRPTEHDRFHRRYVDRSAPATVEDRPGPDLTATELRRLVIWREILGPPVGLKDG